jgi:hypothetical protein
VAILNIVFGTVGTLVGLVGGVAFAWYVNAVPGIMARLAQQTGKPPMPDLVSLAQERAPGFLPLAYVSIVFVGLMGLLLLVSGLGLLKMRSWAWWGSIVFAVLTIAQQTAGVYFNVKYTNPLMAEYYREMDKWEQQIMPNRPPNPIYHMWDNSSLMVGMSLFGIVINCAYPTVLLILLLRRDVRTAFKDTPPPVEAEEVLDVLPAGDHPPPSSAYKGIP